MFNTITVEIHGSPDIRRAPQLDIDSLARLVLELYIETHEGGEQEAKNANADN